MVGCHQMQEPFSGSSLASKPGPKKRQSPGDAHPTLSAGPEAANDLEAAARTLWVLTSYGHGRHFGALLVLFWYVGRPRWRKRFAVFDLLSWCQVGAWSLVLPGPASCVRRCMEKSMNPRSDTIQYLLRGQASYRPKIASNNNAPRQSTCIVLVLYGILRGMLCPRMYGQQLDLVSFLVLWPATLSHLDSEA